MVPGVGWGEGGKEKQLEEFSKETQEHKILFFQYLVSKPVYKSSHAGLFLILRHTNGTGHFLPSF